MNVRVGDPLVRIRLYGLQHDVPVGDLRLTRCASDSAVLSAVARYLDVSYAGLAQARVVREMAGHLTVKPKSPITRGVERRRRTFD